MDSLETNGVLSKFLVESCPTRVTLELSRPGVCWPQVLLLGSSQLSEEGGVGCAG